MVKQKKVSMRPKPTPKPFNVGDTVTWTRGTNWDYEIHCYVAPFVTHVGVVTEVIWKSGDGGFWWVRVIENETSRESGWAAKHFTKVSK